MPLFEIDFTLSITHTETFHADNFEEAQRIADGLYESSWFSDMVDDVTTDYEAFDSDHCMTELSESRYDCFETLDRERINEYLNENKSKGD